MRVLWALGTAAAAAFALALPFLAPSRASAAVTCTFAGGVLDVDVAGSPMSTVSMRVQLGGNDIEVLDGTLGSGTEITPCAGGQPTTVNTSSIQVDDAAGQNTWLQLSLSNGAFGPGAGPPEATGTSEIEIAFNAGDENGDNLLITGTSGPDEYRFGSIGPNQVGANLNADADVDDITITDGENLNFVQAMDGADTVDASGGSGFTGPVPYDGGGSPAVTLVGGGGDDTLTAGTGSASLVGDEGQNALTGGNGADSLNASGSANDTADGGGGTDFATYQFAPDGVRVDLRVAGPQDTLTAGTDTLSNLENIVGSQNTGGAGDLLIGTDGPNGIFANAGDDTLIGLGGNDELAGRDGTDTASYAQSSTGPIAVSLQTDAPQNTGGAGIDTLADDGDPGSDPDIENLIGSPFADNLTGNGLPNHIVGRGGIDAISLFGGPDTYEVLDGILDAVNCGGSDADSGIADEPGVDALTNCETNDHAPQTSIAAGPANGATITDRTPTYTLSANEPSTFGRRVDGGSFQPCAATCTIPTLSNGAHTVRFRATDSDLGHNTTDQTPATRIVTVGSPSPLPPDDTDPPETTITKGPKKKTKKKQVTFEFAADEAGSSFECSLDGKGFAPCQSPATRKARKRRKHSFEVRATDEAGNTDPTPDRHTWKRKKKRR